jgi:hypothetical protein
LRLQSFGHEKVHWIDKVVSCCDRPQLNFGKRKRSRKHTPQRRRSHLNAAALDSTNTSFDTAQLELSAQKSPTQTPDKPQEKSELDTKKVAEVVVDILERRRIGKEIFAQEVLGVSHQYSARLLHYPETWHNCTRTQREQYAKLDEWSQSLRQIESLQSIAHSRKLEKLERRKSMKNGQS